MVQIQSVMVQIQSVIVQIRQRFGLLRYKSDSDSIQLALIRFAFPCRLKGALDLYSHKFRTSKGGDLYRRLGDGGVGSWCGN